MRDNFQNVYGPELSNVCEKWFLLDFRLCRRCAGKTGADVAQAKDVIDGKPVCVYVQPAEFGRELC